MSQFTWFPRIGVVLALVAAGCFSEGERRVAVFPVDGQLLFQGQPAVGAVVSFHPRPGGPGEAARDAVVRDDGHFVPTQPDGAVGLPAGEYALTVRWGDPASDRLGGKYANPDQPLSTIRVTEGINFLSPFKLP
jgi:hypothetical protein